MTTPPSVKVQLYEACVAYVQQRQDTAREAIAAAREAAAEETKSSAGDKYETGRAMAHMDEERAQGQLLEAKRLAEALESIRPTRKTEVAQSGSLITTPQAKYYLAISMGKVTVADEDYFVVSPASPIGQVLMGAKSGDTIEFQGRTLSLEEVR